MSFRDPNPVSQPGTSSDPESFKINSRIMLTAIIVILFVVLLMVSLHLYSRWYLLRSRRFNRRAAAAFLFFSADPSSSTTTRGLDPSVIKSLPVFTFSASSSDAVECSVCLSEFEMGESGRVLPNCKHTFHVDCIDMWFHSHSSCPLCRALVEVKHPAEEVAITISDDGGAGTSEDSGRKPAETEVPRRNVGEPELSRNRVMSFTRMLSRERRTASSSSSFVELGEEVTR